MAIQKQLDRLRQGANVWNKWRNPVIPIDLSEADLSEANLRGADLRGADLRGADLRGADLSLAHIGQTTLGNVDLSQTKGLQTMHHDFPSTIGIDTIYKSQGKIPETFLRQAGVQESFLEVMAAITNRPIEYYTCFISYSSKDQELAERLYADLQRNGVRCWFAPEDLKIGDKFRAQHVLMNRSESMTNSCFSSRSMP
jgi:Pentapeptide repeats (8 copies)/TIR domain